MRSTRNTRRAALHKFRLPDIEFLEVRTLLSTVPKLLNSGPFPADSSGSDGISNFDAIVGASAARSQYKVDGTGMSVAVIDTGVNYNHEALGGAFGTGHKVLAGFDFANNTSDPMATSMDHGTSVAGLVASNDPSHPGVAPGADIVALRVFDNNNNSDYSRITDALQWVIDHHDQYNITAVNLSLSDGRNYAQNWFAHDGGVGEKITGLIGQLDHLNIPVMTAAGNSFSGQQGEGFTGIVADTISVTSTDGSDQLVSNAQRLGTELGGASATDLAAPGDGVTAPVGSGGFAGVTGTSFSTPIVTGAVVLLQQVYKSRFNQLPTVEQIDGWLKQGAEPVKDAVTGITIGRLDIPRSIGLIPNPAAQVLLPPTILAPPVVMPPPITIIQPPAPATPPTPTPPATTVTPTSTPALAAVWFGGKQLNNLDTLSGVPSWFAKALNSLRGWWLAPAKLGNTEPAGVHKTKNKLTAGVKPASSAIQVSIAPHRRTFVAARHSR